MNIRGWLKLGGVEKQRIIGQLLLGKDVAAETEGERMIHMPE